MRKSVKVSRCLAGSDDERECAGGKSEGKAEEWAGRTEWMSRVDGHIEVERGRLVWELLARPSLEHAASVWWTGGEVSSKKLGTVQDRVGRKLLVCGRSSSMRRSRVEETGGKEGREEGAIRKENGGAS